MMSMSREQILEVILTEWAPPQPYPRYSPFLGDKEWSDIEANYEHKCDEKIDQWISNAEESCLEVIIDLLVNIPESEVYQERFAEVFGLVSFDEESWGLQLSQVLILWGKRSPDAVLLHIGPHLLINKRRNFLLWTISLMNREESLPWIRRLITEKFESLTEVDIEMILSALSRIRTSSAYSVLLTLEPLVPTHMTRARGYLVSLLNDWSHAS